MIIPPFRLYARYRISLARRLGVVFLWTRHHEPLHLRLAAHRNIKRLCSPRVVVRMKKPHIRKKRNGVWICTYIAIDGSHWTGRGTNPFTAYIACMRY